MVYDPEGEPLVLAEVIGGEAVQPVGSLAVAHTPEEGDTTYERFVDPQGRFTIEILRDRSDQAVVADTVLPPRDSLPELFIQGINDNTMPINLVEDAWSSVVQERRFGFSFTCPIDRERYAAAVKAGEVRDVLSADGQPTAILEQSDVEALDRLVDPQARLEAIRGYYEKWKKVLGKFYIDYLEDSDDQAGLRGRMLQEAFVFKVTPKNGQPPGDNDYEVTILNFGVQFTPEHLSEFAQAVHDVANATSGYSTERFHTMVALPKDHPSLFTPFKRNAYPEGGTLFVSGERFEPPEEPEADSEQASESPEGQPSEAEEVQSAAEDLLDNYLLPGETTKGEKRIKWTVGEGGLYETFVHEMGHLVGGNMLFTLSDGTKVSLYARHPFEAFAELLLAVILGGKDAANIAEKDGKALQKILDKIEARRESDKEPSGPFVVTGRQVNLRKADALAARHRTRENPDITKNYALV